VFEARLPYLPRAMAPQHVARPRLILGHRRLAIIDLSVAGHQPMSYADRYWIVFNGEVYNYVELREELRGLGCEFRTDSDTEVILAAYHRWGEACLERFNGMWGLAIFDSLKRTLFLARDRFGVKPLYYVAGHDGFAFASEVKALIASLEGGPRVNRPRLMDFLVWNITDHTEETLFQDVRQLPPGSRMTLDVDAVLDGTGVIRRGQLSPKRWYEVAPSGEVPAGRAAEAVAEALEAAVRLRLRADVPVGSCLSGGLDSSSIVCVMSRLLAKEGVGDIQKTFSARSDDAMFDESSYARMVAEAAGAQATFVTPGPDVLLERLDDLVWHQDEPFLSASIFAQWCVFEAAREAGVIVMLDGQGADESLGGYRGFFGAYLASLMREGRLTAWAHEAVAIRRETGFSWLRTAGYTAAYLSPRLLPLLGRFEGRAYGDRGWIDPSSRAAFDNDPIERAGGRKSDVRGMSIAQLSATNLPMLLRWEDRNSMAFSVEARVPFLDYRFVELALALPDEAKVGGGVAKRALRQAMRGTVPDPVLDRKDKMGFVTSEALWVTRAMPKQMRERLADSSRALEGIVVPAVLMQQLDAMCAGTRPYDHRIWRVIVAGLWVRRFGLSLT
jgi:asparagine synthase (glutamine-hydrolysing)